METSISYSFSIKVRWCGLTSASGRRFIFAHSELSSGHELTDTQHICSQSSCHPTQLQSSFHPQNSSRRSSRQKNGVRAQWYKLVPFVLIPDFTSMSLSSSFQDLRLSFPTLHLCMSLWRNCSRSLFLWIVLCIFLFSLLFHLPEIDGSLMDHDLL